MSTLGIWGMIVIFYQTFLCCVISWLTLSCKLAPESTELHEVTLLKLLYLYDPEACGRIHFYNYTTLHAIDGFGTAVVWPVRNEIAAGFRSKMQIWLALHLIWTFLALLNVSQVTRPCGFYVTLLPFTLTGVAILFVDLLYCALFIADAGETETETEIISYINSDKNNVHSINSSLHHPDESADTSWIAIVLAYASIRGVVQCIINFWIVKDSYFDGLALYHRLQITAKDKIERKTFQITDIHV